MGVSAKSIASDFDNPFGPLILPWATMAMYCCCLTDLAGIANPFCEICLTDTQPTVYNGIKRRGYVMEAYAYVRVSSQGQVGGDGFDRQLDTIKVYCWKKRIKVADIYKEEAVSGTADLESRPVFTEMVGKMLSNGVKTVVVEGLDRLAREYRIQETLLVYLASKGLTLISARTGENVTEAMYDDPMKRALVQIQGVFAELEKGLLVKKLKHARDAKRLATGKCEGRKGYADSPTTNIIGRVAYLRNSGLTYPRIAAWLNDEIGTTMDGKEWTPGNVRMLLKRNIHPDKED